MANTSTRLRAQLAANNGRGVDQGAIGVLNQAAERARLSVRFGADGSAALEAGAGGVDATVGVVLAAAHAGMEEGTLRLMAGAAGADLAFKAVGEPIPDGVAPRQRGSAVMPDAQDT